MTEPERAALDHIRRVVESVIGESPAQHAAPKPQLENPSSYCLPVPHLSQLVGEGAVNDPGAVAGTMLVRAYTGKPLTPVEFLNQNGQFNETALTLLQISNVLKLNGVLVETRSGLKLADLALVLFSGRPALTPVNHKVLQQAGVTAESATGVHFLVCVGMDVRSVYVLDPLRRDASGEAQPIPWLTFYRAWAQADGAERTALVPRLQLIRRVKVGAESTSVCQQPADEATAAGMASAGEVFEISAQRDGWGKIGEDRWIDLSQVTEI